MKSTKVACVAISDEMHKKIKEHIKDKKITIKEHFRNLIEKDLSNYDD